MSSPNECMQMLKKRGESILGVGSGTSPTQSSPAGIDLEGGRQYEYAAQSSEMIQKDIMVDGIKNC